MSITYCVPTMGRTTKKATTLQYLEAAGLLYRTRLVCPRSEKEYWDGVYARSGLSVIAQPEDVRGIGAVRAFMFEQCPTRHIFMIDDDVRFFHRRIEDGGARLTDGLSDPTRLRYYLGQHLLDLFETYDTVGIGWRMFCQDRDWLVENKQTGWAWGYDREKVAEDLRPCFGRVTLFEDLDWCIELLKKGHRSAISSHLVTQARRVSESPEDGGCAMYRTREFVAEEAERFYALHADVLTRRAAARPGLNEATQYLFKVSWRRTFREKV